MEKHMKNDDMITYFLYVDLKAERQIKSRYVFGTVKLHICQ